MADNGQQIDISKYRIPTPNKRPGPPPYQPEASPAVVCRLAGNARANVTSDTIETDNGSHRNVSPRYNNSDTQDDTYEPVKNLDKNGEIYESGAAEAKGRNQYEYEDVDEDDSNEYSAGTYERPFKISSTEDNYMLDRFKSKTKANTGNVMHQRSKSNDENKFEPKEEKSPRNGSDFLSKHRKRIAKLKRRFFESQIVTKPLSPKTYNGQNLKKTQGQPEKQSEFEVPPPNHEADDNERTKQQNNEIFPNANDSKNSQGRRRNRSAEIVERSEFEALKARWSTSGHDFAVVIAIDFGTTYSGYAYSFAHEPGKLK